MTIPVLLDLAVAGTTTSAPGGPGPSPLSLGDADAVAAAAQDVGVTALRLVDALPGLRTVDPSVVAGYLAGRYDRLGYLVDLPTAHNAPYNTARRVLSLDRAAAGRAGLVLRPGEGDEVSEATAPDPTAAHPAERWTEYAWVLGRLWESFPRAALLGDAERAVVVDDALIRRIGHVGRFYRVAGPLDGPSSVQGRPVLVAADLDVLDWGAVAASADVVSVSREQARGAAAAITAALERVGRARADVALLGRTTVRLADPARAATVAKALAGELAGWVAADRLDGLELVAVGGREQIIALVRALVPLLDPAPAPAPAQSGGGTLRRSLGLREVAEVLG